MAGKFQSPALDGPDKNHPGGEVVVPKFDPDTPAISGVSYEPLPKSEFQLTDKLPVFQEDFPLSKGKK